MTSVTEPPAPSREEAPSASLSGQTLGAHARLKRWCSRLGLAFAILLPVVYLVSDWATDYVWKDANSCAQCHVTQEQYVLWTESEHRDFRCQECHTLSTEDGISVLMGFLTHSKGENGEPLHKAPVEPGTCVECHDRDHPEWPQIAGSVGHDLHVVQEQLECRECHAREIHRFSAVSASCAECHEEQVVEATGMEEVHCTACHNFLTHEETLSPGRDVCLDCHRSNDMPDPGPQDVAHSALPCSSCHLPHRTSVAIAGLSSCTSCHEHMDRHGLHATEGHQDCSDCHGTHSAKVEPAACNSCHEDEPEAGHGAGELCWSCHVMTRAGKR